MSEYKKLKIGDFLTESKEESFDSDASKRITVRLNCKGIEQRSLKAEKEGATKYFVRHSGQFIYGKQNFHKGAFGIIPEKLDGFTSSADLPAFDFTNTSCCPEYLNLWFQVDERYKRLQKNVKGVGSQRLAVSIFLNQEILLPDLETQKDIVEKVSINLKNVETLTKEIESQKAYAKQLRQNILQDAIEGKLTADWRKKHPVIKGNPDFDAEALFEVIQKEKEKYKDDPLLKRDKPRRPISEEEKEFQIPKSWNWYRMGQLCYPITKGTTPDVHEITSSGEVPYIKMYNIVNQKLDFDYRPQFISNNINDTVLARSKTYPNDVIMNIVGPPMGKIAMITGEYPVWNLNQAMAIFRSYIPSINKYIYLFLNSMIWLKYVQVLGVVGQDNMSLEQCKDIAIPLPPIIEQEEIIKQFDIVSNKLNQLEQQISQREEYANQLMQSILKDAFEER